MQTEYTLTEAEQLEMQNYLAPMRTIQEQMGAALRMVVRQQNLNGDWVLNQDGTKLIRPL